MSPLGYSWAVKGIRSNRDTARFSVFMKTLHPIALRKMGMNVPIDDDEPATPRGPSQGQLEFEYYIHPSPGYCPTSPTYAPPTPE
jgi:hypothetical protein